MLLHAHSGLRWVVLALLLASIVKGFMAASGKKPYSKGLYAATMGFLHIQVVIGLILYVPMLSDMLDAQSFGDIMKDEAARFKAVEHITMMIIAALIATVGFSIGKRAHTDELKNKRTAIFYLIALLLIIAAIPWKSAGMF